MSSVTNPLQTIQSLQNVARGDRDKVNPFQIGTRIHSLLSVNEEVILNVGDSNTNVIFLFIYFFNF